MSSLSERPILIAGGGPVGVITALALARQGLPVHAFEAESKVNDAPRAATTHAATLEMLEELGLVEDVIRRGLVEPLFRIWDRSTGKLVAEFDFGKLKNDTRYPFAVQCEQHKLTNLAIERLRAFPHATLEFSARVMSISQSSDTVEIVVETAAGTRTVKGCYLIGADGGRSTVRKSLGIAFEGYTHPERFLILTTPFDIGTSYPGCTRNYLAHPEDWCAFFKVSGDDGTGLWRVLSSVRLDQTEAELSDSQAVESGLESLDKAAFKFWRPPFTSN
jgi:3-(3-hydroxy-phenyl)propionate hydroxylase